MTKSAEQPEARRYRCADLVVDTGRRVVTRNSEIISMPRLTYRLLLALIEAAPNVLSYDRLVEEVWDGRITSPETIKQRIKLLRDALADDAGNPRYVGLVRSQGCRLIPTVSIESCDVPPNDRPATRYAYARLRFGGLALLIVAAAGAAVFYTPSEAERTALAVLPFSNESRDDTQAFLVDGVSDGLIRELSRLDDVDVIAPASSARYRDADTPLPEIAATLGADAIVRGAVRIGERISVTLELIDARDSRSTWSATFDPRLEELAATQSQIAAAIARHIGAGRSIAERHEGREDSLIDPRVFEAYLRGMHHLNKGTPPDIERGLAYLHEAADEDPGNARAYAGLALGYATYGHGIEPRHDSWPFARAAALRALSLDPTLAEAHAALADVKLYSEWDWVGAEAAFQRARELNPSLAMNYYHYAWYLALFGRFDEAIAAHQRARELDPLTPMHTYYLGALYLYQDLARYEEAIEEAEAALALDPDGPMALLVLGLAQSAGGMHDEAIATVEHAASIAAAIRAPLGLIYSLAGQDDRAHAILAELERNPATPWSAYWQFVLCARLGDLDKAFEWLDYEPHHAFVPWVRVDPWVRPLLEGDPRFDAFLQRLGLSR